MLSLEECVENRKIFADHLLELYGVQFVEEEFPDGDPALQIQSQTRIFSISFDKAGTISWVYSDGIEKTSKSGAFYDPLLVPFEVRYITNSIFNEQNEEDIRRVKSSQKEREVELPKKELDYTKRLWCNGLEHVRLSGGSYFKHFKFGGIATLWLFWIIFTSTVHIIFPCFFPFYADQDIQILCERSLKRRGMKIVKI